MLIPITFRSSRYSATSVRSSSSGESSSSVELPVGGRDHRQDVDAHHPVLAGRQADGTRDPRRGLAAEELEVVGRDRAIARPDLHRGSRARALERLRVDAAERGPQVRDRVDARDRALQHRERARGDVPLPAAAVAVAVEPQRRALRRDRPVLAPASVRASDRRAELDLARGARSARSGAPTPCSRRTTRPAPTAPRCPVSGSSTSRYSSGVGSRIG